MFNKNLILSTLLGTTLIFSNPLQIKNPERVGKTIFPHNIITEYKQNKIKSFFTNENPTIEQILLMSEKNVTNAVKNKDTKKKKKKKKKKKVVEEPQIINPYTDLIEGLTDDEKTMLYKITYAEAGNQSLDGQRAVIEVIFNRVLAEEFPDDVISVLSQKGQFATWSSRNKVKETEEQLQALELVYSEEELILPNLTYVYFSRKKMSYMHDPIYIEEHCFGCIK